MRLMKTIDSDYDGFSRPVTVCQIF